MIVVLRNRSTLSLFLAGLISKTGDFFFLTTFPIWLLDLTGTPTAGGLAMAVDLVPVLALGVLAGVWADRWNKFRTMVASDVIRGLGMLLGVMACFLPEKAAIGTIWVTMVVLSTAGLFFGPARTAMSLHILPKDLITPFTSLTQTTDNALRIIGPLLALSLYGLAGSVAAFTINAASFFVSAAVLWGLPAEARSWAAESRGQDTSTWDDMREGYRYVASNMTLKVLLLVVMIAFAGAGATAPLQVYFVKQALGLPSRIAGVLATLQGGGMILGALLASLTSKQVTHGRRFGLGLVALGVGIILFGFSRSLLMAAVLTVLAGMGLAWMLNGMSGLLLSAIDGKFIGRVSGLLGTGQVAVALVSTLLGTMLAAVLPLPAIYAGVGILVGLSGIVALRLLRTPSVSPETAISG